MNLYQNRQMAGASHLIHLHMFSVVSAGNALQVTQSSAAIFGVHAQQNPAALNDAWYAHFWLDKGSYDLRVLYGKNAASGQLNFYVQYLPGSENLGGFFIDMYQAGTTVLNNVYVNNFVMPRAGKCQISGVVGGKHASSSNYFISIQAIILMKIGD